eukprot:CAMPEP_0206016992 /NCGR_PEP_ID=MMETSP1464-20131121/24019_1 /ASSEMBLY_ACC=CAM_ASM_001124 /TAXON_ID=119497 /ORGANISM="Exanthemachrysis gayraliae, Strain RCC1523" /LENGTH=61 /DNA_ID=CAMNT_0053390823 /DNA_START=144 /DNA_END=327 /DNA_ORIENTATION=+
MVVHMQALGGRLWHARARLNLAVGELVIAAIVGPAAHAARITRREAGPSVMSLSRAALGHA